MPDRAGVWGQPELGPDGGSSPYYLCTLGTPSTSSLLQMSFHICQVMIMPFH